MPPRPRDQVVAIVERRKLRDRRRATLGASAPRTRMTRRLRPRRTPAARRDPPSSRTSWMAVASRRALQGGQARDVRVSVRFRARNPVLRDPGAAAQSQWPPTVRWTLRSHPGHQGRARHLRAVAYVPLVQSHPSAQDPPIRQRGNPRLQVLLCPMHRIRRKVDDLEVFPRKEVISQWVPRVQQRGARILPRRRESLTSPWKEQVPKNLMARDRDPKVQKMIKAIMNRTDPLNKQVCIHFILLVNIFKMFLSCET